MSTETSTATGPRRNPLPRPALRFEGDEHFVVAARPLPGEGLAGAPEEEPENPDGAGRRKGKGEKSDKGEKAGKRDKGKANRRRKADKKRAKEAPPEDGAAGGKGDPALAVSLPPEFRRALERAAGEHGLSPEGLAAFVLVEWLDR